MADDADLAQDAERLHLELLLMNRRRDSLPETGLCHNCLEVLPVGLFCDAACREDHDKRQYLTRQRCG
ncbi:hypothetical protein [Serratia bockelmannii]|uniref:hypothetical protein n=1 Tax=Serratia bockelmannii TaxID=2703793 RepID=UPI00235F48A9|nr:hypothetical protein [Serratia bockelmannii]